MKYANDPIYREQQKETARNRRQTGIAEAQRKARHARDPRVQMLAAARARAKRDGLEFAIERNDIVVPEICPILGITITCGSGRPHANSPSIDRVKPHLGYVKGNVRVISYRANTIKSDATYEELKAVHDYMLECERIVKERAEAEKT